MSTLNKIKTQSTVKPTVLLCFNKWENDTVKAALQVVFVGKLPIF